MARNHKEKKIGGVVTVFFSKEVLVLCDIHSSSAKAFKALIAFSSGASSQLKRSVIKLESLVA